VKSDRFVGRPLDSLCLKDRWELVGKWVALEIYTPESVPLRIIEAVADSARNCILQLKRRGLDPHRYEYFPITPAYEQRRAG
jgi:hypothetical protein